MIQFEHQAKMGTTRAIIRSFVLLLCLSALPPRMAGGAEVDISKLPLPVARKVDFVRDVQPILADRCYVCHGPDKQQNDLRWDVKAAALRGGLSGPAILPGKSAESRMIHLVAGLEKGLVMPQKGEPLSPEQIGLLRAWIDQGAQWPDGIDPVAKDADKANFWTFKPVTRPPEPMVKSSGRARTPVDRFVLAKLEHAKLAPSPEADRIVLIRRLSFDLTGLPPSIEEVEQFVADEDTQAYENLVDRLLASPRYGERWGRHWLDVVHYGETHGYDKDKLRPHAWPYRDYVIRSFNEDKPYSRFVEEQLAGDVLFPEEPDGIVATGFIAAGPWDYVGHVELPESKTDGLIARYNDRDDMVMTAMSTFQSLTVHCARCHDHKFDPITQRDYYGLQAVFAGVDRANRTFDLDKGVLRQRRSLTEEKKSLEARQIILRDAMSKISNPEIAALDERMTNCREQLASLGKSGEKEKSPSNGYHSGIEKNPDQVKWVQVDLGKPIAIEEVRLVPARPTDFPDTPGFGLPRRFRVETADEAAFSQPHLLIDQTAADLANPGDVPFKIPAQNRTARFVRVTAIRLWERTQDYVFALAELQVWAGSTNAALSAAVSALDSIEAGRWAKANLVDDYDSRRRLSESAEAVARAAKRKELEVELAQLEKSRLALVEALLDAPTRLEWRKVSARLAEVEASLAILPPPKLVYAAAHEFAPEGSFKAARPPRPVHLLSRGDVKRPGQLMRPGAIAAVPGLESHFDLADLENEGQRRAALAGWITDRKNLLTRRSIVNRIWQYHFGRGIVESPNDFGHMGSLPSHPELLDWLAWWFLDQGESIKKLHRLLLTSATYRQSSRHHGEFAKIDGDNRYLWRMNRTRLDAESIRDAMLAVSEKLDVTMGGPSVQQFFFKDDHSPVYDYTRFDVDQPSSFRRSVYRHIVRSVPDPFMDCLDAADPSLLTPKRNTTLTALQALATLNNPFVVRQAEHFAERVSKAGLDLDGQIEMACKLAWCRAPADDEKTKLAAYARKHGLASTCRLLLNSTEFMFVD